MEQCVVPPAANTDAIEIWDVVGASNDCHNSVSNVLVMMGTAASRRKELTEKFRLKRRQLQAMLKNFLSLDEEKRQQVEKELDMLDDIAERYQKRQQQLLESGYDWLKTRPS